jgi:tetratricopeptide (TPR) repeat protein
MKARILYRIAALFLFGLLSACVSFDNKVNDTYVHDENSAYVYGILHIRMTNTAEHQGGGLVFKNKKTGEARIYEFDKEYKITLAKIPPGEYLIEKIVFTSRDRNFGETREVNLEFAIKSGEALYFGDIIASADMAPARGTFGSTYFAWGVDAILHNFEGTTEYLEKRFPWTRSLSKINFSRAWRIARKTGDARVSTIKCDSETKAGKWADAKIYCEEAYSLKRSALTTNNLAWLYAIAKHPDVANPKEALLLAQKAVKDSPKNTNFLDTLAAAYAANKDFTSAVKTIELAIELSNVDRKKIFQEVLKAYQNEKIYY